MSVANDLTEEMLRTLAQARAEQETVLSLYLDLDPQRFATPGARASEIDSLLDGAHREIESGERPHAEHEAISFGDDVHGRQDTGGWSQSRYQRSHHEDVKAHLRHVARTLQQLLKVAPYDRLLIACTEQLWPRVVEELHPEVRALLHDERLSLDVGDAGIDDVVRAAEAVLAEEHRAHEDAALAELREHLAREGDARAAAGLDDVLEALVERRVATLFFDADLQAPGVLCPSCGWMCSTGESCPADGAALEARSNIIEDALRSAIGQSAEILSLRDRPELGPLGGIAATLRF